MRPLLRLVHWGRETAGGPGQGVIGEWEGGGLSQEVAILVLPWAAAAGKSQSTWYGSWRTMWASVVELSQNAKRGSWSSAPMLPSPQSGPCPALYPNIHVSETLLSRRALL